MHECIVVCRVHTTHAKAMLTANCSNSSSRIDTLNCAHCTRAHAFDIEYGINESNSQFKVQRPQPRITFITRRLHHIVRHSLLHIAIVFIAHIHIYMRIALAKFYNKCKCILTVVALRLEIWWRQVKSISKKNDMELYVTYIQLRYYIEHFGGFSFYHFSKF